ncbi:MAG: hypothetical protein RMM08_07145 [Armatimonadota bacterium]|nr:hypothetical protein [bacterium]MDW8321121.1 hypothetical protein [Armatimonadota bacterium]
MSWGDLIVKWIHVVSIVTGVGLTLFQYLVLLPVLRRVQGVPEDFIKAVQRRAGMIIGIAWVLIWVTGIYNLVVIIPTVKPNYHILLGAKILLVLVLFFVSTALSHPSLAFEGIQRNRAKWVAIAAWLGVVIVVLSATMNTMRLKGIALKEPPAPAAQVQQPPPGSP